MTFAATITIVTCCCLLSLLARWCYLRHGETYYVYGETVQDAQVAAQSAFPDAASITIEPAPSGPYWSVTWEGSLMAIAPRPSMTDTSPEKKEDTQ